MAVKYEVGAMDSSVGESVGEGEVAVLALLREERRYDSESESVRAPRRESMRESATPPPRSPPL